MLFDHSGDVGNRQIVLGGQLVKAQVTVPEMLVNVGDNGCFSIGMGFACGQSFTQLMEILLDVTDELIAGQIWLEQGAE